MTSNVARLSEMQLFKIPVLKPVSIITLIMIRSMATAVFVVTRVDL